LSGPEDPVHHEAFSPDFVPAKGSFRQWLTLRLAWARQRMREAQVHGDREKHELFTSLVKKIMKTMLRMTDPEQRLDD
jgi:hypothetical protein